MSDERFGIIGIDPGAANAAVALLTCDMNFEVVGATAVSLPTRKKEGTKIRRLDEVGTVNLLDDLTGDLFIKLAVVEFVGSRPGQSAPAMWAFADATGFLRGYLRARGYEVLKVASQTWQRSMGLRERSATKAQRKRRSRELAQTLCPDLDLSKADDADKAEALLMAEHGRMWLRKQ